MQVRRERVKCRRTYCWHNDTRFNYERAKRVAGWHGKHQPKDKVDHLAEVVDEPQATSKKNSIISSSYQPGIDGRQQSWRK